MGNDAYFTSDGRFATTGAFFEAYKSDSLISSTGITPEFKEIIAEAMVLPFKEFATPFTDLFMGRPLDKGVAWKEKVLKMASVKKRKPKATAEDAFGFYESAGKEAVFQIGISGWVPVTVPSMFDSGKISMTPAEMAEYANAILDSGQTAYQLGLESQIAKKLVSNVVGEIISTEATSGLRKAIRDASASMRSNKSDYLVSSDYASGYIVKAPGVTAIMEETTYNTMIEDLSTIPSPDKIVNNVTFKIIDDGEMPTPLTTAEYTAGNDDTSDPWTVEPLALDQEKPDVLVISNSVGKYRPYGTGVKINDNFNGASDTDNYHILYQGGMGIKPWEKCARIVIDEA